MGSSCGRDMEGLEKEGQVGALYELKRALWRVAGALGLCIFGS